LILGAAGAGKTSLLKRFISDEFSDEIAGDFVTQQVDVAGKKVDVHIYHNTTKESIEALNNVIGCVFVFDVTSQDSFDALAELVATMNEKLSPKLSAGICCNKVEDDNTGARVVTFTACKDIYAKQIPVFETSAKSGKNVKTVFNNMKMLCGGDLADKLPPATEEDVPLTTTTTDEAKSSSSGGGGSDDTKKKKEKCLLS